MKRLNLFFALIFSGLLVFLTPTTLLADAENLNGVVAIVNSDIITQTEFNTALSQAKQQFAGSPNAVDNTKLRQMVMKQLIDQKLQLEIAKHANVKVTDQQVTAAIQHVASGNHLTLAQLKDALKQHGTNYADYRKMIHKQLVVHQVAQSAVASKIRITPADIADARAQIKAQAQNSGQRAYNVIDILAGGKAAAEKITMQLKNGGDISKVAPDATDLGWKTPDQLPALFLAQLKNMQPGDIVGPVKAPNGFHVLKLVAVHGQSAASLTKQQVESIAYQIQLQKAVEAWMKEIRKTAYIKIISP